MLAQELDGNLWFDMTSFDIILEKGINFVRSLLSQDGLMYEFDNDQNVNLIWVSAFVL